MATTINGSAGVITNSGAVYDGLQTGTAVASTSGTSIDFTGIPSWVKRITVMFSAVSTSGTNDLLVQIGDSGGVETSGYLGSSSTCSTTTTGNALSSITGFTIVQISAATFSLHGSITLTLLNSATNLWAMNATLASSDSARSHLAAGSKSLSATLDRVRITTVNGTDTFDAGSINIMYE